jgi:hypothetical protein
LVGTPAESFCHTIVDYLFLEDYISLAVNAGRTSHSRFRRCLINLSIALVFLLLVDHSLYFSLATFAGARFQSMFVKQ